MIKILLLPASSRRAEMSWFLQACVQRTKLIMDIAGDIAGGGPGLVVVEAAVGAHSRAQVQELIRCQQPDLVHVMAAPHDWPTPADASEAAGESVGALAQDALDSHFTDGTHSIFASSPVQWVLLDGCANPQTSAAVAKLVDWVIGTPAELTNELAAEFFRCLYRDLGQGKAGGETFAAAQRWLEQQRVETARVLPDGVMRDSRPSQHVPTADASPIGRPQSTSPGSSVFPVPTQSAELPISASTAMREFHPKPVPTQVAAAKKTRHLNAGFYLGSELVKESEPLWLVNTYRLGVNLGAPWGPGKAEAGIPEQFLARIFEAFSSVELDVVARSPDIGIAPPVQKIRLPKTGDSQLVFFTIAPVRPGRQSISVDLLYQGHLLQSRRLDVTVAHAPGLVADAGPIAAQDGYLTFTRTAELSAQPLSALKDHPRQLTIVAERDPHSPSIGLRFYDQSQTELAYQDSRLSEASLATCITALRSQLVRVMTAYAGPVRGTPEQLGRSLGALADVGRMFYRALLPSLAKSPATDSAHGDTAVLRTALTAGAVVQVAPLSSQLSVPWELLYERPIESYREGSIRLCTDFARHGSAATDCPHHGNPQVVCPHGFWGYRYIIEQLPCRIARGAVTWATLPLQLVNEAPMHLLAVVNPQLARAVSHLAALSKLPGLSLQRVDNVRALQSELTNPQRDAAILYFYTHGGKDASGAPYLELGPNNRLQSNDLDAWEVSFAHKPLVILNACDSANFSPESFDDLIQLLYQRGAAGIMGTQCEVREILAGDFMLRFLGDFLRQVPAGQALLQTRLALLHENDPRGLAYSLFAAADVKLGRPVV